MSTVDEIKAAAMKLPVADKLDLYWRLNKSDEVRQWRLQELRREILKGIASLERGDFTEHDAASLDAVARGIKKRGRERLRGKTR